MKNWEQGRATVEDLLTQRELSRVPANHDDARSLVERAELHVDTARKIATSDPRAAYTVAYDAARQALTSLLWVQGLRPTAAGGHRVVYDVLRAQLDPPMGQTLTPFDRMRRERNEIEYPTPGKPAVMPDINSDLSKVEKIIDIARRLLPQMPSF